MEIEVKGSRLSMLMCWIAAAAVCLSASLAQGAMVNLQAWITYSLFQSNGTTWLPDGSVVQIIGSSDGIIDPMPSHGTNVIATTTGDDIIIGTVLIDSTLWGSNGTFYSGDFYFDNTVVDYMYIRFFDTTYPVLGFTNWGVSGISTVADDGVMFFMDFGGGFAAVSNNNFVQIPEPSTASLLLLFAALLCGVRAGIARTPDEKGSLGNSGDPGS